MSVPLGSPATAQFSGRTLVAARIAGAAVIGFLLFLFVLALPAHKAQLQSAYSLEQLAQLGLPATFFAWYVISFDLIFELIFVVVVGIIFWRRSPANDSAYSILKPRDDKQLSASFRKGNHMQDKTQLIQRFNQARDEVRALLPEIDIHMQIYPGWTIKEVLAHLAGWDDATILALQAFAADDPPAMPAARGIDLYNAQTVAERSTLNYEQIVREWELVREQLIPILGNIPDEKLAATIVSPWGPAMTVAELINVMTEHEEEHAQVIRTRQADPGRPPETH